MKTLALIFLLASAPLLFALSPPATAPDPAAAAADTATAARVAVIPARFELLDKLRINTGKKDTLADGSYNNVYIVKKPGAGDTFARFDVQIAGPDSMRLGRDDLKLVDESAEKPLVYHPFDWFVDNGLAPDHRGLVTVPWKAELEFTIEAPEKGLDALVLYIGPYRVGTVASIRERTGNGEDSGE